MRRLIPILPAALLVALSLIPSTGCRSRSRRAPKVVEEEAGLATAYAVPMRSDEVVILWAAHDFRHLCALSDGWDRDPALRAWRERSEAMCLESETLWLVPSTDCFFHPSAAG